MGENLSRDRGDEGQRGLIESLTKSLVKFFALGFWLGRAPWMPGTVGTLLGVPLVYCFYQFGNVGYMVATYLFIAFSVWICHLYEERGGPHDASEVVIDEVAGFLVAMTWLPMTWQSFLGAFVLFRVFDIWKPLFIGHLDRKVGGGLGVVLDDVAAGLVTSGILQVMYRRTDWLGESFSPVIFNGG